MVAQKSSTSAKIPCEFKGIKITATFYVTDTSGPAIIGLHTATQLNLVKFNLEVKKSPQPEPCTQSVRSVPIGSKQDLIAWYPECFDGIGKLKGEYHITLDPAVPPVVHPPRKVPISMKEEIKDELDNMVAGRRTYGLGQWSCLPTKVKWKAPPLSRPKRPKRSN